MKHQQRQRGRGRKPGGGGGNNGGGGGGNHSNRAFESNGPDMKVRGSASHIYEKYLQLARDANSSGDRVMAESYLQHAEHYYRVLRAMQPAHQPAPERYDTQQRFGRDPDLDDDESDEFEAGAEQQGARDNGDQPEVQDGREDGRPPQQAYRDDRGPRQDGPRNDGPRNDGQRNDGQRNDGQRNDGQRNDGPRAEGDDEFRRGRRNRRNRFRPDGERGPRLEGESLEAYDAREPREPREPREDRPPQAREPREEREPREPREPRAEGDERPPRRERAPRREQAEAPEGFADSPKPAFLAGD